MGRYLLSFVLLLLAFLEGPIFAKVVSKINVIPVPKSVKMLKNGGYKITGSTRIIVSEKTYNVGKYLAQLLRPATGFKLKIVKESKKYFKKGRYENAIVLITEPKSKKHAKEGYSFRSDGQSVVIRARATRGIFYGCQTLRHLLPGAIESKIKVDGVKWDVPGTEINDKPRFSYRGMHLDVGRHFMKTEEIKKYIDHLAMYKINYLHWHLTEDQGWRIEIKKYPKLTKVSAWRDQTIIGRNDSKKYDGKRYGGFYTQKEIRDIVAYAGERFITIIPEIELPGHTSAVLAAYPELGCTGGPYKVRQNWGVSRDVFCAGNEKVYDFLEGVFEEVLELFPSKYIHIGGDECRKTRWEKCPKCQKRIKEKKLGNEEHLQSYFVNRIGRFLEKKGRKFIGWEEILEGNLSPGATVMGWQGEAVGIKAAKKGYNVIMTPKTYCYFDYYQSRNPEEPLAIGGFLPLEKVYSYDPIPAELSRKEAKHILGAQANVWTEYMKDFEHVEYMVLPRLCALAEVVWSQISNKNFSDFNRRLSSHITHLDYLNVNYRLPSPAGLKENYIFRDSVNINIIPFPVDGTVHYTIDGSQPTKVSPIFKGPMTIKKSMILKARNVTKTGRMSIATTSTFRKLVMKKASKLTDVKRGLKFSYYDEIQKRFREVPNFSKLKVKRVGVQEVFGLPSEIRPNFFAINFEGYIKVPSDGIYTFYTRSDDGSLLYIGDEKIVDNNGLHGAGNLVSGQVLLKKGFHKIRVGYFQASGGKSIKVVYEGPKIERQIIPSSILFHK